jgi:hypothetical protein
MCVTLGWPPLWIAEPETGIAWKQALHGEQPLTLHRPLAVGGSIRAEHRITAVDEKGTGRGALVYFNTELSDATSSERLATLAQLNSCASTAVAAATAPHRSS